MRDPETSAHKRLRIPARHSHILMTGKLSFVSQSLNTFTSNYGAEQSRADQPPGLEQSGCLSAQHISTTAREAVYVQCVCVCVWVVNLELVKLKFCCCSSNVTSKKKKTSVKLKNMDKWNQLSLCQESKQCWGQYKVTKISGGHICQAAACRIKIVCGRDSLHCTFHPAVFKHFLHLKGADV